MARPRSFDLEAATERAMEVFWRQGYDGAALPDLLSGMGLTRGSVYKAFGDKKSLFIKALRLYENRVICPGLALLTDPKIPDGRQRIRAMFATIATAIANADTRGCLLCSAAAGPAAYDLDISKEVARGLARIEDGLISALAASPKHKTWNTDKRRRLAQHLATTYVGLRLLSRSLTPIDAKQNIPQTIDEILS